MVPSHASNSRVSRPHIEKNTAKGNAYMGAARHGHFYVVVDKKGSLGQWTDFPPLQAYGVEGWWLDSLLKQGASLFRRHPCAARA